MLTLDLWCLEISPSGVFHILPQISQELQLMRRYMMMLTLKVCLHLPPSAGTSTSKQLPVKLIHLYLRFKLSKLVLLSNFLLLYVSV